MSARIQWSAHSDVEIADVHLREMISAVKEASRLKEVGMPVDDLALREAQVSINCGSVRNWSDALAALSGAALVEPAVFGRAWQRLAHAIARARGCAAGEAANVAPPLNDEPSRWASAHGQGTVTATGALRIEVPITATRNLSVTLPPINKGARRAR